jgi:ribonuclease J
MARLCTWPRTQNSHASTATARSLLATETSWRSGLTGPISFDGIEAGFYVKDGNLLTLPGDSGVYERRTLADVGVITIALGLSGSGKLVSDIEVVVDGLPDQLDDEDADSFVLNATSEALRALPAARKRDVDAVAESLRKSIRGKVGQVWGKRPVVHVHALLIDREATG